LLQSLQESGIADFHFRIVRSVGHERANGAHFLALLRPRRGHAAAASPKSVMNSRRLIGLLSPSITPYHILPHRCRNCCVVHHSKIDCRMAEMGHQQTSRSERSMSAPQSTADT
jgi:hypothetical protein